MKPEFKEFLKKENLLTLYRLLPKAMQRDIENKFDELRKENKEC